MSLSSLRIVMFGTGDFAVPTFLRLCDSGASVIALVTQPDRPQGRKQELIPSRIKLAALERDIPVLQPEDVNADEAVDHIRRLCADVFVTAAYGQILSAKLLGVPRLGGLNLHGSLLPSYRGAAPVARAIQCGESQTGVTVILMNPKVDAGGMLDSAAIPIDPNESAGELEDRLAVLGAPLIEKCLSDLAVGRAQVIPQDRARVTKAPKLRKEDGLIDWTLSARQIHDLVRAMKPWPLASSFLHRQGSTGSEPLRVIVHRTATREITNAPRPGAVIEANREGIVVATGSGALVLTEVQIPGKKPMRAEEFLRGRSIGPGDRFGPA